MNKVLKNTLRIFLFCCMLAVWALPESKQQGFHRGEIIAVNMQSRATAPSGGVAPYYISVHVDDTVYMYLDELKSGQELPWKVGQSLQVQIVGESLQVERSTGEIDTYAIVSAATTTAISHLSSAISAGRMATAL